MNNTNNSDNQTVGLFSKINSGQTIQSDILEFKKFKPSFQPVFMPMVQPVKTVLNKASGLKADYEDLEISNISKEIAERLAFPKANIPHFYLIIECNVDKLNTLRAELNKHSPVKISVNDLLIKAASLACLKVPETNSSWQSHCIRKYKNVDMSVAVQTEFGLMTPIITNSNLKGLSEISKEMKDLSERAHLKKLKPQEFQGGTFTIWNMGMLGITNFSASINPPQVNWNFKL